MTAPQIDRFDTPVFMFTCLDGPATKPLRSQHMEGHLIHIEQNNNKYLVAGPVRQPNGTAAGGDIIGSFFIIAAESEAEAKAVMKGDPYMDSNMYETITVQQFVPACGAWMGGVIWDRAQIMANVKKYS